MDRDQQELVRTSFAKLEPDADAFATIFYHFLFEFDPELRPLFKGDLTRQRKLLMTMIATAVDNLDRLGEILPAVRSLGRRHAGYGVTDRHYDTVASALLLTLASGLGSDFTPAVREAWVACYETLARVMQSAAHDAADGGGPRRFDRRDDRAGSAPAQVAAELRAL